MVPPATYIWPIKRLLQQYFLGNKNREVASPPRLKAVESIAYASPLTPGWDLSEIERAKRIRQTCMSGCFGSNEEGGMRKSAAVNILNEEKEAGKREREASL